MEKNPRVSHVPVTNRPSVETPPTCGPEALMMSTFSCRVNLSWWFSLKPQSAEAGQTGCGRMSSEARDFSMGKPWENHGKMVVYWWFNGILMGWLPNLAMTVCKLEKHNFYWESLLHLAIFHSYVKLPEGTISIETSVEIKLQQRLHRKLPQQTRALWGCQGRKAPACHQHLASWVLTSHWHRHQSNRYVQQVRPTGTSLRSAVIQTGLRSIDILLSDGHIQMVTQL